MSKLIAIYPGTFDPITNGHIDIIKRSVKLFDKLIIGVINRPIKTNHLFSADTREYLIRKSIKDIVDCNNNNIEIKIFDYLLVDFVKKCEANVIIRGLRAVTDFEYEFQMELTNKRLNKNIETLFMMTSENFSFLSSSLVKEIASYSGDISEFVPDIVNEHLQKEINN